MAHPKRKQSKSRRDKRRTHYTATTPSVSSCGNCGAPTQPHKVCPECGHYRGKQAVEKSISI